MALGSSLLLQLAVIYTPLASVFGVAQIPLYQRGWIGAALAGFVGMSSVVPRTLDRVL
jgi:hypothetical protein